MRLFFSTATITFLFVDLIHIYHLGAFSSKPSWRLRRKLKDDLSGYHDGLVRKDNAISHEKYEDYCGNNDTKVELGLSCLAIIHKD